MCCQSETQQGVGMVNDQVNDCPRSCYSSCQSRPVALSFTSDPFFDQTTRTVSIQKGEPIAFSFVVSAPQKLVPTITVEYGDGQHDTTTEFTGQVSHTYACQSASCTFVSTLMIQDVAGIQSVVTPLTQIKVVVQ